MVSLDNMFSMLLSRMFLFGQLEGEVNKRNGKRNDSSGHKCVSTRLWPKLSFLCFEMSFLWNFGAEERLNKFASVSTKKSAKSSQHTLNNLHTTVM